MTSRRKTLTTSVLVAFFVIICAWFWLFCRNGNVPRRQCVKWTEEHGALTATNDVLIGTHNSATGEDGYGFLSALVVPFSVCQGKTLAEQHAAGTRYFDLRVRHTSRGWICAHGLWESRRLLDDILEQLSAYSNTQARIWYEGMAPERFVNQVESWRRRYGGIDIVEAGSRRPWRTLKTWRTVKVQHKYLALGFSSWHTLLPVPWLWKKVYHNQPEFNTTAYTMVDFL